MIVALLFVITVLLFVIAWHVADPPFRAVCVYLVRFAILCGFSVVAYGFIVIYAVALPVLLIAAVEGYMPWIVAVPLAFAIEAVGLWTGYKHWKG
jgi:hypothetical protein